MDTSSWLQLENTVYLVLQYSIYNTQTTVHNWNSFIAVSFAPNPTNFANSRSSRQNTSQLGRYAALGRPNPPNKEGRITPKSINISSPPALSRFVFLLQLPNSSTFSTDPSTFFQPPLVSPISIGPDPQPYSDINHFYTSCLSPNDIPWPWRCLHSLSSLPLGLPSISPGPSSLFKISSHPLRTLCVPLSTSSRLCLLREMISCLASSPLNSVSANTFKP